MKSYDVTIQMKATEQYFPVVLFIILYKVVLTFGSVGEILWCDHSNESYWAVLSCGTVYYAVQDGSNFWVGRWNPMVWPFKWHTLHSTSHFSGFYKKKREMCSSVSLLCCTRWFSLLSLCMKSYGVTIQMKNTEQYFPVVLFIMLYKVILTFKFADEII